MGSLAEMTAQLTIGVFHRDDLLVVVQIVEEGCEDAPAGIELIITDKVGLVALEAIQDQGLIRLRNLEVGESSSVGQVEFGDNGLHAQTRKLGVHLDVDTLVGLDTHDKFVSGNVLKDT